ncbi:MAG: hypothetical protein RIR19_330 [Chloroflexota bacterium]|jgi:large subunit ribosomal protein L19
MDIIRALTDAQMKTDLPQIKTGDTVKVAAKVVEGTRERIQTFEGTVMRMHGGGLGLTITVRRIASGVGVERTFKVHSPRIDSIEVVRHGISHRAQLYFLRDRVGKRSSLREKLGDAAEIAEAVATAKAVKASAKAAKAAADSAAAEAATAAAAAAAPAVATATAEPVTETVVEPAVEAAPAPSAEPTAAAEAEGGDAAAATDATPE